MASGAQGQKQWGITPPVSMALPTEAELKLNQELMDELKRQNMFESPEGVEKRKATLQHFQKVGQEFIRVVARTKKLSQSIVDNSGGMVATFGSYRLGAYNPDSDIDTLLVAPRHVSRDDFFDVFPSLLKEMSPEGAIDECVLVREAHVPIQKIVYNGIAVDLIFVSLKLTSVPADINITDNNLLRGLDETDLRSINGVRVSDEILQVVPQVKSFRIALRAIKLWANRRAVYSNISGFPGGVAWAMMVARVCQLYPMATSAVIVGKVLDLIARWNWPRPIQLKQYEKGPLDVREWNPQLYGGDRRHIMPVITPAYPSMCATNNITPSTMQVIIRELQHAATIHNQIYEGKKSWRDLFQKHAFFTDGYKYYLSVIALSRSKPDTLIWSGFVHSKVRLLIKAIENADSGVAIAHPYVDGFDRVHKCKSEEEVDAILHGELKFQTTLSPEERKQREAESKAGTAEIDANGTRTIYTTTYYIGLELSNTGNKKLDISFPVAEFKHTCLEWDDFRGDMMAVCTVHTRNYDLPADCFEEGEKKPEKPKKKKAVKGAKTNGATTPLPHGGLIPSTPYSQTSTPTIITATASKKRALDAEVRVENAMDMRCDYEGLPSASQWLQRTAGLSFGRAE